MGRRSWKSWATGAIVAVVLLGVVPQADAFWGRWGCGYYCAPACTVACYSPCYYSYSCYYPCYSPCYYGCWSPCYSVCCDPCWGACYDPCCVDGGAVTVEQAPTKAKKPETAPTEAPEEPSARPSAPPEPPSMLPGLDEPDAGIPGLEPQPGFPGSTMNPTPATSGLLTIYVPYEAKVTINGLETKSTGSRREYVSHGLKPGYTYEYTVRAEIVRDGKPLSDERTVVLTAGERDAVAFGFNIPNTDNLAAK